MFKSIIAGISLLLLSSCALTRVNAPSVVSSDQIKDYASAAKDAPETYVAAAARYRSRLYAASQVSSSAQDPASLATISDFVDAGITVSRMNCDSFFRTLQADKTKGNFARTQANTVGSTAISAMGLAGIATPYVAGAGAALGLLNATFDNVDSTFLVSPDIASLEALVNKAQMLLEQQILVDNPPKTFGQAERAVLGYDHICTYSGMKVLLNQSVGVARPVVVSPSTNATTGQNPTARLAPRSTITSTYIEIQ